MNAKEICRLYDHLKGGRGNWETHWEDVTKFVLPKKMYVNTDKDLSAGEKRAQAIYDATAVHANELLASALSSMLTNPSLKWFGLSTGDLELDKDDDVREYLQKSEDTIFKTINESNFNTEVHEYYTDLPSLGTGFMFIDEHEEYDVYFKADSIYNQVIDENKDGRVDVLIRKLRWNVEQMHQMWGDKIFGVLDGLKGEHDNSSNRKHDILHAILPINDKIKKTHPELQRFSFTSMYILKQNKSFIDVKGFFTFPAVVGRWTKMTGERYGRSPAMKSLPDIKMLDKAMYITIKGGEKVIDPPLLVPDDGHYHTPDITPGGINYYRPGTKDRIEHLDIKSRPDFGFQFIDRLTTKIERAFFIDQLQLREGPQMTATEVVQRTEENLRLLGPVLGRQHFEFLAPLIDRVFDILQRKGKLPKPPQILAKNRNIKVQYASMIAKAQKLSQVENLNRAIGSLAPLVEMNPEVLDNFNTDEAFNFVFDIFGLPQDLKTKKKAVKQIREQRAEARAKEEAQVDESIAAENFNKTGKTAIEAGEKGLL